LLDYRLQKKYTMLGLCSGAIAGLIGSTPSSGAIPLWASCILGIMAGVICNYGTKVKQVLKIDDTLDLFALHGVGGILGLIFNGFFATTEVISLDGVNTTTIGGFLDQNYKQLPIQLAYICACSGYVFVVTAAIAKVFCLIPLLDLRASNHAELIGMDEDQIGEFAEDFVEVRRTYDAWTPPTSVDKAMEGNVLHRLHAIGDRRGVANLSVHFSPHYVGQYSSEQVLSIGGKD